MNQSERFLQEFNKHEISLPRKYSLFNLDHDTGQDKCTS